MTKIHIGQLIRKKVETEGYSACLLAKLLHCDRSNIYKIYRKQTIDTEFLLQISKRLTAIFSGIIPTAFVKIRNKDMWTNPPQNLVYESEILHIFALF
jgi:hypothetical protein